LQIHILSRIDGMNGNDGMLMIGQTDMNGVDIFISEELFIIVVNVYFPVTFQTAVEGCSFFIITSYGSGSRSRPR